MGMGAAVVLRPCGVAYNEARFVADERHGVDLGDVWIAMMVVVALRVFNGAVMIFQCDGNAGRAMGLEHRHVHEDVSILGENGTESGT